MAVRTMNSLEDLTHLIFVPFRYEGRVVLIPFLLFLISVVVVRLPLSCSEAA